jgi:hypothetical protein
MDTVKSPAIDNASAPLLRRRAGHRLKKKYSNVLFERANKFVDYVLQFEKKYGILTELLEPRGTR